MIPTRGSSTGPSNASASDRSAASFASDRSCNGSEPGSTPAGRTGADSSGHAGPPGAYTLIPET